MTVSYIKSSPVNDSGHVMIVSATDDTVGSQPLTTVHHGIVEGFWGNILYLLSRVEIPDLKVKTDIY